MIKYFWTFPCWLPIKPTANVQYSIQLPVYTTLHLKSSWPHDGHLLSGCNTCHICRSRNFSPLCRRSFLPVLSHFLCCHPPFSPLCHLSIFELPKLPHSHCEAQGTITLVECSEESAWFLAKFEIFPFPACINKFVIHVALLPLSQFCIFHFWGRPQCPQIFVFASFEFSIWTWPKVKVQTQCLKCFWFAF